MGRIIFIPRKLPKIVSEYASFNGEVLQEHRGQRIVRFSNYYIIKYGLNISLIDSENVRFVRETGTASVPEVFAL
ncbi:Uncharacterized protein HZ326_23079 [Fusarium oxysporum f. sp. albedinis]|nr:Uncharacterized protein HZ326_23079 [Fusarium oxysporum f. sp. albedinis]